MNKLDVDDPVIGSVLILLVVLVSVAVQWWTNKRFGRELFEGFHEVGGIYLSTVGTLYSVILGLILVDASGKYNDAKQYVEQEAISLTQVYGLAGRLPPENRGAIQSAIKSYIDEILGHALILMDEGKPSEQARQIFRKLATAVGEVEPMTENQKAMYPAILDALLAAEAGRRGRLNFENYSIPGIEWVSLLMGGMLTVGFTFFFALKDDRAQAIMTAMVTLMVALNLYVVFMFDQPFSGGMRVSFHEFQHLQDFIASQGADSGLPK